ncbi:MAG: hypothetical protein U0T83_00335 [Bacteriovoracaceae bacterium]
MHRKLIKSSTFEKSLPIAVSLLPTLVFGLVMVEILETNGEVNKSILGALVIYILVTTILPSSIMKVVLKRTDSSSIKLKSSPLKMFLALINFSFVKYFNLYLMVDFSGFYNLLKIKNTI